MIAFRLSSLQDKSISNKATPEIFFIKKVF